MSAVLIKWGLVLLVLVLLVSLGMLGGWYLRSQHDAKTLARVGSNAAVCTSANQSQAAVIDHMRAAAAKRLNQMQTLHAKAQAILANRDALQAHLAAATDKNIALTRSIAHETPACADLEHGAICPAVSDRLWPAPAASAGAAGGH